MVMKGRLRIALALLAGSAAGCFAVHAFRKLPERPVICTVRFVDNYLSQTARDEITTYCTSHKNSFTKDILEQLIQRFPSVKSVRALHTPPDLIELSCISHAPRLLINNELVLVGDETVVPKAQIRAECRANLASLSLDEIPFTPSDKGGTLPLSVTSAINKLPHDLFEAYRVHWHSATDLQLSPLQAPDQSIKITAQTNVTDELLATCLMLIERHKSAHKTRSKLTPAWVADARFANQIVIYRIPGGSNHG